MSDQDRHVLTHAELVTAILRQKNVHDGLWMLLAEFGIAGMNIGPSKSELSPAAVVPILKIGIVRVDDKHDLVGSNIVVDAAAAHPTPPRKVTPSEDQ